MKTVLPIIAVTLSIPCFLNSPLMGATLSNIRAILDTSRMIQDRKHPLMGARISPDMRHVLVPVKSHDSPHNYRLVLIDTETGQETELPLSPPRDMATAFTRFQHFDPNGGQLVLSTVTKGVDSPNPELVIYNITHKTVQKTGLLGPASIAIFRGMMQFDHTGQRLIVSHHPLQICYASLPDAKLEPPSEHGMLHDASPAGPYIAIFGCPPKGMKGVGFRLIHIETGEATALPLHNDSRFLDDSSSVWSLDGRYIAYRDLKKHGKGHITRIWNIDEKKETAALADRICLGPGPTHRTMIIKSSQRIYTKSFELYDLKTQSSSTITTPSIELIHAWRSRVLYINKEKEGNTLYIADVNDADAT